MGGVIEKHSAGGWSWSPEWAYRNYNDLMEEEKFLYYQEANDSSFG